MPSLFKEAVISISKPVTLISGAFANITLVALKTYGFFTRLVNLPMLNFSVNALIKSKKSSDVIKSSNNY